MCRSRATGFTVCEIPLTGCVFLASMFNQWQIVLQDPVDVLAQLHFLSAAAELSDRESDHGHR